jgi:predicted ATPase/class 3 adenylate cyclase
LEHEDVITFCFTDVAGSTSLWDQAPGPMAAAMARHDELVENAVAAFGGELVRPRGEGDSRFAVFPRAAGGARAALAIRSALSSEPWPTPAPIRVRCALHTGPAELRAGDYYGSEVNRCARLRGIAHPGQIVLSQAAAGLVAADLPSEAALVDLGSHQLPDLARPEHVYQLSEAGRDERYPPLRSAETVEHNLPVALTSFVGRGSEIDEVEAALSASPLVTLTGPSGTGKTRLALEVAARQVTHFRDGGVWLVELAPVAEPNQVVQAVATTIGVREVAGRSLVDVLAQELRDRATLIVLDGCEHVLDASADLARTLLRSAARLRVLATSHAPLGLTGEAICPVAMLAVPQADAVTTAEALGCDAVRLFVERASLATPRFSLTDANASIVIEVCRRLDGIPLAIELAAARLRMLPLEQLAARLADRFSVLTGGARTALPRHQTLRAALEWTFRLLDDRERTVLARLAVFAGGFSLRDAEAVCAGGIVDSTDVFDALTSLVDKSLVTVSLEQGPSDDARFGLLETIRQFASEQLGDDVARMQARHAAHFLELAERVQGAVHTRDEVTVFRIIDLDDDNLEAALTWASSDGNDEMLSRLATALAPYWVARGRFVRARRWLTAALATPAAGRHPELLWHAGTLAAKLDDYRQAVDLLQRALDEFVATDQTERVADCLAYLGEIAVLRGELDRATELGRRALELGEARGQGDAVRYACYLLGWIAEERGDLPTAERYFQEHLEEARRTNNDVDIAYTLVTLAELSLLGGDTPVAAGRAGEAEALAAELDDQELDGYLDRLNGMLRLQEGDATGAYGHYLRAARQAAARGRRLELGWCTSGLAAASTLAGDHEQAARLYAAADAVRQAAGAVEPLVERRLYEHSFVTTRQALTPDAFAAAWEAGSRLDADDILALAAAGSAAQPGPVE